jgi:hypothetical protein
MISLKAALRKLIFKRENTVESVYVDNLYVDKTTLSHAARYYEPCGTKIVIIRIQRKKK